jgi:hypothetical protein
LAMKKLESGREVPASLPPAQDGPEVLSWTAGTNTW